MRKDHRISWIFSVVKMNGLEPSTPCMSSRYSNQLSYTHIGKLTYVTASIL